MPIQKDITELLEIHDLETLVMRAPICTGELLHYFMGTIS